MKFLITEKQYKILTEDNRTEFPGIKFFGGNWDIVEELLGEFLIDGKPVKKLTDIKEYLIDRITKYCDKYCDKYEDILLYDDDLYYKNEKIIAVSSEFVTTEYFNDEDDDTTFFNSYDYDELPIEVLQKIYNYLF